MLRATNMEINRLVNGTGLTVNKHCYSKSPLHTNVLFVYHPEEQHSFQSYFTGTFLVQTVKVNLL